MRGKTRLNQNSRNVITNRFLILRSIAQRCVLKDGAASQCRACATLAHPRLWTMPRSKTWMAGTSPAVTANPSLILRSRAQRGRLEGWGGHGSGGHGSSSPGSRRPPSPRLRRAPHHEAEWKGRESLPTSRSLRLDEAAVVIGLYQISWLPLPCRRNVQPAARNRSRSARSNCGAITLPQFPLRAMP
jgi:hypothetical protein